MSVLATVLLISMILVILLFLTGGLAIGLSVLLIRARETAPETRGSVGLFYLIAGAGFLMLAASWCLGVYH
jgi:hypothetical protein